MKRIAGLVLAMALTAGATAQEMAMAGQADAAQVQPERGDSLSVGAGAVYSNGLYRGADDEFMGVPMIFMEKGQFFIKGRTAGYRFYQDELWAFDAIAQWRFDGYEEDDSDYLEGMDDRDMTIDGGAALTLFDGWGQTSVSLVSDLLSKHSGQELAVTYSKSFSFDQWTLTPSAGVRAFSSSLGDYYYGVQPEEAIAGRPAYDIGDTWNPYAGLHVTYRFNEQWSALLSGRYTMLDSDIEESPIVEDGYDLLVMAGVLYNF